MVRRSLLFASFLGLAVLLASGGLAAGWTRDDVAAAERYRETERERALRYRAGVEAAEAREAKPASRRPAARALEPSPARPAFWNAWSRRLDEVDDWRSARTLFRQLREQEWPRWRNWLVATAALFEDRGGGRDGPSGS